MCCRPPQPHNQAQPSASRRAEARAKQAAGAHEEGIDLPETLLATPPEGENSRIGHEEGRGDAPLGRVARTGARLDPGRAELAEGARGEH